MYQTPQHAFRNQQRHPDKKRTQVIVIRSRATQGTLKIHLINNYF